MSGHEQASSVLAEQLRQAVGRFVRATREQVDALPRTRAEVLGQLDRDGPQTIAQLAVRRGVRHQSMSRLVGELTTLDLVAKVVNPADARGWVISLSRTGRAALEQDRRARRDLLAQAIEHGLDDEERRVLAAVPALLEKLSG